MAAAAAAPAAVYTPEEIAGRLRVSARTVTNQCRAGKIKAYRVGVLYRIPEGEARRLWPDLFVATTGPAA